MAAGARTRSQELSPGPPCGWQGPNYLSRHSASQSLRWLELAWEARCSAVGRGHLNRDARCLLPVVVLSAD